MLVLGAYLAFVLPICTLNYTHYGVFRTDEYNTGSYAAAYGALSRANNPNDDPHIAISYEQRQKLYALSPAFAELEEILDGEDSPFSAWIEEQGEYRTGYFSFILRDAAQMAGKYESTQTADEYFRQLADEVNAICDAGLIDAGPKRSGITSRFYPWMAAPVAEATVRGMWLTLNCHGIDPLPIPTNADDAHLLLYEEFVHDTIAANRDMPDGSTEANYILSGWRLWMQRLVRVVVLVYRYLLPLLFFAALAVFLALPFFQWRWRRGQSGFWPGWVAAGSLLCAFLLRSAMIGYVHVGSFGAIESPVYQAACYPVVLGFIGLTALVGAGMFGSRRAAVPSAKATAAPPDADKKPFSGQGAQSDPS